jgi:sarcosine oxidase/L-pipecolate oxidase
VHESLLNVQSISKADNDPEAVKELYTRSEIEKAVETGGRNGDWGYVNRRSGWADAEAGMRFLRKQVENTGRVLFLTTTVSSLLYSQSSTQVLGIKTRDGATIKADLTILATGAWTGKLVDLRGRAQATGQVLCYLDLTEEEQEKLGKMPVLLNMSTGMFIIPPRNRLLKVARHGYGYSNPVTIPNPSRSHAPGEATITVSLPRTKSDDPSLWVPPEGEAACRQALTEMIPSLASRPFTHSKICWYTDTPNGDFLITYHPDYQGLFLATGGSGHGYKFLPVIGDKIADCVEGKCPPEFARKWAWPKEAVEMVVTEDGSRGGRPGMVLDEELAKGMKKEKEGR